MIEQLRLGHDIYDAMEPQGERDITERVADVALEAIGLLRAVFGGSWLENTENFVKDIGPRGAINFFENIMTKCVDANGDRHYHPIRTESVAHKPDSTLITDYEAWRAIGASKKGEGTVGGRELSALEGLAGRAQPLTIDGGDQHNKMKAAVKQRLEGKHLRHTVPAMFTLAREFWQKMAAGNVFNATEAIPSYVSRVNARSFFAPPGSGAEEKICPMLTGEEWDQIPAAVEECGKEISAEILFDPRWVARQVYRPVHWFLRLLGIEEETQLEREQRILAEATERIMEYSKQAAEGHGEVPPDIMGMIEFMYSDKAKGKFSAEEIESATRLMFVVGQRTTSVTFEALLMFLCEHPEWQEKVRKEFAAQCPDGEMSFDTLHSLPILHSVIWETLRLKPPVPLQTRELAHDLEYKGVTYKKGTMVAMIHRQAQRNPDLFKKPNEFDPSRWKTDGEMRSGDYGTRRFSTENTELHTFSMTPHRCCGRVHALTVLKLGLLAILEQGTIEPENLEKMMEIFDVGGFVLSHSDDVRVKISK